MKILLVTKATGDNYSVEAGLADNVKHFDHHGEHSQYPSPSNNPAVPVIPKDAIVEITHVDADTLLGLARMSGMKLPDLDYDLIEKVDTTGSSAVKDKSNPSYLYMVGVGELSKKIGVRRSTGEPVDVTDQIEQMLSTPTEQIIELGREATALSEATYKDKRVDQKGVVGLWEVGANDPLDPSRPYQDGIDVVVVYRDHFKSISIYCSPSSEYAFGNTTVAGIPFAGHPKACGSPRGEEFSLDDAKRVFDALVEKTSPEYIKVDGHLYKRSKPLPGKIRYKGKLYVAMGEGDFIGFHCQKRPRGGPAEEDSIASPYGQGRYQYVDYMGEILDSLPFTIRDIALERGWMENVPTEHDDNFEEWMDEVSEFLEDHDIKWIFVSNNKPLMDYGDYCYEMYLTPEAVLTVIEDIGVDDSAQAYVYDANVAFPTAVELEEDE